MNVVNLTLNAQSVPSVYVFADGKLLNFKKQNGTHVCRVETENDECEITVCRITEMCSKFWFLYSMLFFFISLMGIFDAKSDKKYYFIRYRTVLTLNGEHNVTLNVNRYNTSKLNTQKQFAVNCVCNCFRNEYENEYYVDEQVRKRLKTLKITKLLIWLAAIIATVVTVIFVVIT